MKKRLLLKMRFNQADWFHRDFNRASGAQVSLGRYHRLNEGCKAVLTTGVLYTPNQGLKHTAREPVLSLVVRRERTEQAQMTTP